LSSGTSGQTLASYPTTMACKRHTNARHYCLRMERTEARKTREGSDGLGPFEQFVEATNQRVSRAPFFFVCVAILLLWLVSVPLWHDLKSWQVAIHTVSSVLSLLLLVLLENAGRRAQEAAQEKLNVIAEGLVALMHSHGDEDPELQEATRKLRDAIGLEERH
jgi:low affinity Fe/Cu permease